MPVLLNAAGYDKEDVYKGSGGNSLLTYIYGTYKPIKIYSNNLMKKYRKNV